MKRLLYLALVLPMAWGCSDNKENNDSKLVPSDEMNAQLAAKSGSDLSSLFTTDKLNYQEITFVIHSKNIFKIRGLINKNGGRIDYDPNLEVGQDIGWVVATLPAKAMADEELLSELDELAEQISVQSRKEDSIRVGYNPNYFSSIENIQVPVEDIGLDSLQARFPNKKLGEDTLVAIIDTGIDAYHPVFQDRVIFWSESSQETKTPVAPVKKEELSEQMLSSMPKEVQEAEAYARGMIDESRFWGQLSDLDKQNQKGIDLNRNNKSDDKFLVLLAKIDDEWIAYVDINGDEKISAAEYETGTADFNRVRSGESQRAQRGFVQFQSRARIIKYPLLIETEDGEPKSVSLGVDSGGHGTHVAGIVGGRGEKIVGAAPYTKFMAVKVCSGITCTNASLLRGLVKAFYNPQGLVPDVVNISLGSHEQYKEDLFGPVIRDLSAKFGTVFYISASNSGPGFRSINSIGALGPAIHVAAHVSKRTIVSHYPVDPAVNLPEHMLLSFSSLGPSYTGILRPNISAPGSAVSSTPLVSEKTAMWNGTSMSSPISAGAGAALLSVLKDEETYQWIESLRAEKRENLKASKGSLISIPLMWRQALEDSATRMEDYTLAHQGYGLINADRAYDSILLLSNDLKNNGLNYTDLKVNQNDKEARLYDRRLPIANVKKVEFDIVDDGELSDQDIINARHQAMVVKLEKVEIQDFDGSKEESTYDMPFAISQRGIQTEELREAQIRLAGIRSTFFYSYRKLEKMEAGKTYVAHYSVWRGEQRLTSVLDIVHKPLTLSNELVELNVPSLGLSNLKRRAVLSKLGQNVEANAMHRYPFAVGENDTQLEIDVALSPGASGHLYVQLYNTDGENVGFEVIKSSDLSTESTPRVKIKTDTRDEDGNVEAGVYELLISAGDRLWMGPTQYDFVIQAERLVSSANKMEVVLGEKGRLMLKDVFVDGEITVAVSELNAAHVYELPVQANYWTMQKLSLPTYLKEAEVILQVLPQKEDESSFFGRLDHRLFANADDSFEKVLKAEEGGNMSQRLFKKVTSGAYFGVETISVIPENSKTPSEGSRKIKVRAAFTDATLEIPVTATKQAGGMLEVVLDTDAIDASALDDPATNQIVGTITVESNGRKMVIPVEINPKEKN